MTVGVLSKMTVCVDFEDDSGGHSHDIFLLFKRPICHSRHLFLSFPRTICHSRESGNPGLKEWIPNQVGDDSSNDIPHLMRNPGSISSSNMKRMNPF